MPSLVWPSAMGSWSIDSTLMCGPAWRPDNLEVFWMPPPNRGTERDVPGVVGSVAYGHLAASRTVDVWLKVSGATDQAGSANANETAGFQANIDTLWALVSPPTMPTVTRTSTLTMPDASTREAEIIIKEMSDPVRESGNLARLALTITIPAGAHYAP